MNHDDTCSPGRAAPHAPAVRETWAAPRLTRLGADAARSGANPLVPEGQFAAGS